MNATKQLLRRLSACDEGFLQAVLRPGPSARPECDDAPTALSRKTRALVELAALLAVDAATPSLRWAAERAAITGADDETLVRVLLESASSAGSAQTATGAERLALALDLDVAA